MSLRGFTIGTVFGAVLAALLFAASGVGAGNVSAQRLEAAREMIGNTVKVREFERMLRQVIQGFSADIMSQTRGRNNRDVVRVLMEQAGVVISENRGKYLEGIAHIYATHLRAGDLKAASDFFSSRAGRRWVEAQDTILEETVQYAVEQGEDLRDRIVSQSVQYLQSRGSSSRDQ